MSTKWIIPLLFPTSVVFFTVFFNNFSLSFPLFWVLAILMQTLLIYQQAVWYKDEQGNRLNPELSGLPEFLIFPLLFISLVFGLISRNLINPITNIFLRWNGTAIAIGFILAFLTLVLFYKFSNNIKKVVRINLWVAYTLLAGLVLSTVFSTVIQNSFQLLIFSISLIFGWFFNKVIEKIGKPGIFSLGFFITLLILIIASYIVPILPFNLFISIYIGFLLMINSKTFFISVD